MANKRTKGVTFWGYLFVSLGIIFGLINAARNIWSLNNVVPPVALVIVGIGILSLKNWARWACLILILTGIMDVPSFLQSIKDSSQEGLFILGVLVFSLRFIVSILGIIFFINPAVREQFKKGE